MPQFTVDKSMSRVGRPPTARIQSPDPTPETPNEVGPQEGSNPDMPTERLMRTSRRQDKFHIDTRLVPDGWSYEWKRESVYGQPDPDHQVNLRANHWRPVPVERHPNLMPPGHTGAIKKDGMVLMERPLYLTQDAQMEDYQIAMDQVRRKEEQLGATPPGTFDRSHPSAQRQSFVRRGYGPLTAEEM